MIRKFGIRRGNGEVGSSAHFMAISAKRRKQ